MKVFGGLAFVSNPVKTSDKFQPRGVQCVFLGYPATHKGYKLMNLLTNQAFVSRDVVFHEHIFPYQQSSSNQYEHPFPAHFPASPFIHVESISEDMTAYSPIEYEQVQVPDAIAAEHPTDPPVETR